MNEPEPKIKLFLDFNYGGYRVQLADLWEQLDEEKPDGPFECDMCAELVDNANGVQPFRSRPQCGTDEEPKRVYLCRQCIIMIYETEINNLRRDHRGKASPYFQKSH
jgi:hypothetical protein